MEHAADVHVHFLLVVHAGRAPVGTEYTGPGPFGALMKRYPDLTVIAAHLGAPDYGPFLRMAVDYERVARWRCSRYLRRPASSSATRSRGRAGLRWPSRPVMSSFATSALTTASSVACTTAS